MSAEDVAAGKKSTWTELEITGTVRNLGPDLWKLQHLTSLYLNLNNITRIPPEINRLTMLTYLDLSSNKLRSLPSELGDLSQLRELLLYNNLLRMLPFELGKLFNLQNLGLKGNPLSPDILNIYNQANGTQLLLRYMLDHLPATGQSFNSTAPTVRPWIPVKAADKSRPSAIFTVMCYNVLCDKYCTRQMYGYCPTWALNWEYRKKGIIEEIRHGAADIISLQEVETDQFHNFFLPELQRDGYDGIFSAKSRARTMTEADRKHVDGCAIFFKTSKFNLVKEDCVEFNQLAMANAEGSDDMLNRVMTKDNIGLAAMLETKEGAYDSASSLSEAQVKQPLVVATAHIHWDPEFSDVKLIQTMMLMWRLKQVMEENFTSTASGAVDVNSIPLILCGDLNSLPESGVVEYLLSGKVARTHTDFKDIGYEDALQKIHASNDKDSFCHDFRLNTAYEKDIMPFTNYTYDFKGIIDYIFYSKDHMNLIGMLGPLEEEWFRQNKVLGCPHPHVPSDHFPLLVEFEMPARSLPGSQGTPPLVQYR